MCLCLQNAWLGQRLLGCHAVLKPDEPNDVAPFIMCVAKDVTSCIYMFSLCMLTHYSRYCVAENKLKRDSFSNYILSSIANATLHLILNNSLTILEIHSKFGREIAMPFAKIISEGQS